MCNCKYCNTLYGPRPQVKNPRACDKESCQMARQRDNEKEWREQHRKNYDKEYQEQQRVVRDDAINDVTNNIIKCLEIGKEFLGSIGNANFNLDEFKTILSCFFSNLGIRRINKFWIPTGNSV